MSILVDAKKAVELIAKKMQRELPELSRFGILYPQVENPSSSSAAVHATEIRCHIHWYRFTLRLSSRDFEQQIRSQLRRAVAEFRELI